MNKKKFFIDYLFYLIEFVANCLFKVLITFIYICNIYSDSLLVYQYKCTLYVPKIRKTGQNKPIKNFNLL